MLGLQPVDCAGMLNVQDKVDSVKNPEGLHVYRKQLDDGTCDPGWGQM